jgi:glycerate 2-kinase
VHILIAPNAFKNALEAAAAAEAIRRGLRQSKLRCTTECFPVGDGGDGTAALMIKKCGGKIFKAKVSDPLGRKINATFGLIDKGKTAVIELADASGLRLLRKNEFDPLRTSTFGTGELIKSALDKKARKLILGVGGSATVDGGVGILQALGVRFLDARGKVLPNSPENMIHLESIDLSGLDKRMARCILTILCDVENPLLGKHGAAKVFGPQKGATPSAVKKLEAGLKFFSEIIFRQTGRKIAKMKHGGAAGGVPAGLSGLLNANLANGIGHFLGVTHFDAALRKADLVVTGEGSIDEQTLHGKGPFGVALRAKRKNIPVIGLAGKISVKRNSRLKEYFDLLLPISDEAVKLETAMQRTAQNLRRTAMELGNSLAVKSETDLAAIKVIAKLRSAGKMTP